MPANTKVHRCVEKVKAKGGNVNAYAVCQASTGQSYATGKAIGRQEKAGEEIARMAGARKKT